MAINARIIGGKKVFEVYVNGTDPKGRRFQRRKRGIKTMRQAEEIQFQFERELANLKDAGTPYTWGEWFAVVISRIKKDSAVSTVMNYQAYLGKWVNPIWNSRDLKSISRDDVYKMVFEEFGQDLSPNSRKTLLKLIKRVFQMAIDEGIAERNPALGIKVQTPEIEQEVLTNEEVKIFLQSARETNHRFYPVWLMALMTGMRSGELFALTWNDIDLEARLISVSKQWTNKCGVTATKTRRTRVVPISEELLSFLREFKLSSRTDSVLPALKEWENGSQAEVTREFCEAIGVTSVKFHDLRATFITNLLARGVPLAVVMAMVGHTQIKTTNVYLRRAGVDIKGGTDKLGYGVPQAKQATLLRLIGK